MFIRWNVFARMCFSVIHRNISVIHRNISTVQQGSDSVKFVLHGRRLLWIIHFEQFFVRNFGACVRNCFTEISNPLRNWSLGYVSYYSLRNWSLRYTSHTTCCWFIASWFLTVA
uniref:Uncharacterized protein n=1 Tax=Cacopsylla melanoneura TaxID=428564 RepID=A0A8D8Z0T1_9HEMI